MTQPERSSNQMVDKKVWTIDARTKSLASMFLKEKLLPSGTFDKMKVRLVAEVGQTRPYRL